MKKLITFFTLIFIALASPAHATVHLDLTVNINLDKSRLEVSGTASKPVALPNNMHKVTEFSYNWPLPAKKSAREWRGGAFVSEKELYLPSGWHPIHDEHITFTVAVNSPVVTVLPGKITDENQTETSYSARFSIRQPTEGIPLFAGPYKIAQLKTGATRLRTYFFEGMESLSKGYLERTAQYIQRFSKQIGPYPFDEFHIIAAPVPAGYGFAGLTYVGKRVLQLPFIKETSLGHEILHNYWGNGIFPDYDTGNWAEGLTTYMADYMTSEIASKDKAKEMRLSWLRDYSALPTDLDKPVTSFVSKHGAASQVIGYHKVAFIFHMLRQSLGEEIFFKSLRQFWAEFAFKTASWTDLENTFSAASGQDLSAFFTQWVQQKGAPFFKNISARARFHKGRGWEVNATVVQVKPPFQTHVPVAVGTRTAVLPNSISIKGPLGQGKFWIYDQPTGLSLDPDFQIFRKLGPNEAPPILRDVMLAEKAELVVPGNNTEMAGIAQQLAGRMIEGEVTANNGNLPTKPFVIIGQNVAVNDLLKKWGLPANPLDKDHITTSSVWAAKLSGRIPYVVVSSDDAVSLQALVRPLPHYGKRSALLFEGRRAFFKTSYKARPITVPIH